MAVGWTCFFTSPLIHSAATIRATAFEAGVRYDPAFPLAQDYDLWVKLLRHGRAENLAAPLILYRVHPTQATQLRAPERLAEQETIGLRAIEAGPARLGADESATSPGASGRVRLWRPRSSSARSPPTGGSSRTSREPPTGPDSGRRGAVPRRRCSAGPAARQMRRRGRYGGPRRDRPEVAVAAAAVKLSNLTEARRLPESAERLLRGLAGG